MKPLSEDLRRRIIQARQQGAGTGEVAQRFGVSRKSVQRFWRQHQRTGHCRPKQTGGYRRLRLAPHGRTLRRWIARQADLTLVELQQRCSTQLGITALWHRLDRLGLSYKKNDARRRARPA
jgi:transposase